MKLHKAFALAVMTAALLPGPLWAQMDMLPFLFRDLPPEFEQGVPAQMTYQEFRQLNRKVDFFTIGMSMIWPGYASGQVERLDQALLLGGARWASYGLMGAAVWRQWDSLENVGTTGNLSSLQYEQVKGNMALFIVGASANMFLWGADVLLAYHQAMEDRDRVIYRYGLAQTVAQAGLPDAERLRRMAVQDDPRLRATLIAELQPRLATWSTEPGYGEFSWYLGNLQARDGQGARAVATLVRGLHLDAHSAWAFRSKSLLLKLLAGLAKDNPADAKLLTPGAAPEDDSPVGYLGVLPDLVGQDLRNAFLELADQYLQRPGLPVQGDLVLSLMARAWAREGRVDRQSEALVKIGVFYPDSPLRP